MTGFGDSEAGSAVQDCPLRKKESTPHWIEIQLVGEDDSPVPGVEYQVVLPNGDVVHGYLDDNGRGRVDSIEAAGDCKVTFPEMDRDAWKRVTSDS
jgi:hypothetical protein